MREFSNQTGTFIMIDGIDGSGKSTIMNTWAASLEAQGKRIFSLKEYWTTHGAHPTPADARGYDVIISAEPTSVWTGAAIRQEMILHGSKYSAMATAHAYALDRLILYTRFLVPLRAAGKLIIQDRGVSTSLCYQSLQGDIPMDTLAAIEGNAFALEHAPDLLVLTHIDPALALARIGSRYDKQDNAIFEQQAFLERAHAQFHSDAYHTVFTQYGTAVRTLDTACDEQTMKARAITVLQDMLSAS